MDYLRTKIEFTAYIKKVIENASKNYIKSYRRTERELVEDFTDLSEKLLSVNDDSFSFCLEKGITYGCIENLFTDERHYRAMQKLSDNEKLVLYLTSVKDMKGEQVSKIMNTTQENIRQMKSRAIKAFKGNLSSEK